MYWTEDETCVSLYTIQINEWHVFEMNAKDILVLKQSRANGGLYCSPWQWNLNDEQYLQIIVMNL